MALVLADRVQETTNTTGTGTLTLSGAVAGYQGFSSIGNGNSTYYTIISGPNWETGIGTYTTSGSTLSRDTVLASSAAGAAINVAAGAKVFVSLPATRTVTGDHGLFDSAFIGNFADGIVLDYASGFGRITVAGADGIKFYSNSGTDLLGTASPNGDWDFTGYLSIGPGSLVGGATNPLLALNGSTNQYVQGYIHNDNAGTSASADFSAYPDNGTDASGWIDMGITSSVFSDALYSVTGPNEAYLFGSAPSGASKTGNLVFATDSTGTSNAFQWYVGGFDQAKTAYKMQLNSTELLIKQPVKANGVIESTTGGFKFPDGTTQTTAAGSGSGDMSKATYDTNNDGIVDAAASVPWSGVTSKPTFATVATSGLYSDLSGTPTLATVATSGAYSDLSGTPTFKTIDGTAITGTGDYSVLPTVAAVTGDMIGVVDRTAATLSFNDSTRTFTVTPVSGSWTFYYQGVLKTVSSAKSIVISNTDGARWIKIDPTTLDLVEFTGSPGFDVNVNIAYIYWDLSNSHGLIIGDERHGSKRDTTWHSVQHSNVGTVWRSGGGLTYTLNNASTVTIGVGSPVVIQDEDLTHTITHAATPNGYYQQVLETAASLEVMYLDGTSYNSTTASTSPWIAGTSLASYNYNNGTTWSLADATEGSYISYWLLATNDIRSPVKLVLGRVLHASIDAAYTEEFVEYGLSFAEQVFMYQIVVKTSSSYTGNSAKIQIAGVRKILAKSATSASATVAATNHNDLTGRSADDAHSISSITGLQTTLTSISPLTTKGDIYTRSSTANARLPVGADNLYLATDSASSTGLVWKSVLTAPVVYTAASLTLTNGVYVSGSVTDTQTLNDGNFYQITDGTLAGPAWIITFTINGVASFNRVVANVDYTLASGHTIYFQLYNNITAVWDNIGSYSGATGYSQYALEVLNYTSYISSGTVQARLYHSNTGNAVHTTKLDYFALEQANQGAQGPRGPTGATGTTGAGVVIGGTTGQSLVKASATDYDTTWADRVASVGGTLPISSSGGTTPTISISQSTTSTDGYLSSTDWNTFNGKQAALVSDTNIKTINGTTVLGSGNIVVGGAAEVFTFGGTGTPTTGTALTPYLRVMSALTCASASLVTKTAPTGNFTISILRSADGGVTFPDTVTTITVTSGNRVATSTPTTALAVGDLLRLDISTVNGAADWTAQLYTTGA